MKTFDLGCGNKKLLGAIGIDNNPLTDADVESSVYPTVRKRETTFEVMVDEPVITYNILVSISLNIGNRI
jgi:hypothetical protein